MVRKVNIVFCGGGTGGHYYPLMAIKQELDKKLKNKNIYEVFQNIYDNKITFVSRGDNSGTYKKEVSLWKNLSLKINTRKDRWYLETGSGMGPSLNIAVNKNAITLTDRATWISFNNKKNHTVLVEGDKD